MSNIFDKSTLEYYNYGEQNRFQPAIGPTYKVKVSDKDGNIITIEKDDSLYAMVSLDFDTNSGVLKLLDVAHDNSVLAEIEMPNADYIYNCRFDESLNAILFDVKSLYGSETSTIELDIESLIELYEAGQGIEIGEKNEETGRRPISIKLAEGENILKVDANGLSISDEIATDDELEAAVSGKASIDYVDELVSGITSEILSMNDEIEHIKDVLGTDDDDPDLDERINSKADLDEFNDLEDEVGEIETNLNELSGKVDSLDERLENVENELSGITPLIDTIYEISGNVETLSGNVESLSAEVENNKVYVYKVTTDLPDNVREAYIVKNNIGEQLGERIDIYKDSTIVSIEYIPELQVIRYVYIDSEGVTQTVDIDLSKIVIESEFADGLQVVDGVVSVKLDPSSDNYISVSEDGIKLSGIFDFFQQLIDVDNQQWGAITGEAARAQEVEGQLWGAINGEIEARQSADNELSERVDQVQINLDNEVQARQDADDELSDLINQEKERAIDRENEIEASIDDKINIEKQRAESVENALSGTINTEKSERQNADNELSEAIEEEISNRKNADLSLSDRISNLDGRIVGFENNLSAETTARIQRDEELSDEIAEILRTYVTKEYVDNKDLQVFNDAVNSAVTSSNQYTDNVTDDVKIELKEYSDSGDTELQGAISRNTTKINAISNLLGVIGDDTNNYDDSGNGILDVLHKEFHELIDGLNEDELDGLISIINSRIDELENRLDNLAIDCGTY